MNTGQSLVNGLTDLRDRLRDGTRLRIYFDFDHETYCQKTEEAIAITGGIEVGSGTDGFERDCDILLPVGADEQAIRRELQRSGFRFQRIHCSCGKCPT